MKNKRLKKALKKRLKEYKKYDKVRVDRAFRNIFVNAGIVRDDT